MTTLLALLGVFLIGLSKAGFATGLGMLSTPLMAQALPARTAIGVILPLLCLADVFTLAVYWRRWDLRRAARSAPGRAWAMLLKHLAYIGMVALTAYLQFALYPSMTRLALLAESRPEMAAAERDKLARQEIRFLRLNVACAMAVLLFTAIATAV